MKIIFFIILLFCSKILGKGGSRGRSSGSKGSGKASPKGLLKYLPRIRFTSSGRYGRSILWFSNHYVNIHYIGHHNYYDEEEYDEGMFDINEELYLIYVINGTFLRNHLENSKYEITGHYITFSEYNALSDFIQNITEFKNIFGNETRIILSSYYYNDDFINNTIIDYINDDSFQKIMIDVIIDVHYVPFYKLFPKFSSNGKLKN